MHVKPSGIEWVGRRAGALGNDTSKTRLHVLHQLPSTTKLIPDEIKVRLCNYTDVYYQDRINAEGEYMEATASSNEHSRFKLLAGDTVITKDSEDWREYRGTRLGRENG